jgi:MYXO-CTERM domain-containing protein
MTTTHFDGKELGMLRRILLGTALMAMLAVPAFAHDGYFGSVSAPIILDDSNLGGTIAYDGVHQDAAPFKGWAFITVKNNGSQPWGDFHFGITGVPGYDDSSVIFDIVNGVPLSSQNPTTWSLAGSQNLNATFYTDPVNPGEIATFQVYTDNTAQDVPFFGLTFYPTPVPVPAALWLLAAGAPALLRRRR